MERKFTPRTRQFFLYAFLIIGIIVSHCTLPAEEPQNLLPNGDITKIQNIEKPLSGWGVNKESTEQIKCINENGNTWIQLTNDAQDKVLNFGTGINLQPEWESIKTVVTMRARNLKTGKENWHNA